MILAIDFGFKIIHVLVRFSIDKISDISKRDLFNSAILKDGLFIVIDNAKILL